MHRGGLRVLLYAPQLLSRTGEIGHCCCMFHSCCHACGMPEGFCMLHACCHACGKPWTGIRLPQVFLGHADTADAGAVVQGRKLPGPKSPRSCTRRSRESLSRVTTVKCYLEMYCTMILGSMVNCRCSRSLTTNNSCFLLRICFPFF